MEIFCMGDKLIIYFFLDKNSTPTRYLLNFHKFKNPVWYIYYFISHIMLRVLSAGFTTKLASLQPRISLLYNQKFIFFLWHTSRFLSKSIQPLKKCRTIIIMFCLVLQKFLLNFHHFFSVEYVTLQKNI